MECWLTVFTEDRCLTGEVEGQPRDVGDDMRVSAAIGLQQGDRALKCPDKTLTGGALSRHFESSDVGVNRITEALLAEGVRDGALQLDPRGLITVLRGGIVAVAVPEDNTFTTPGEDRIKEGLLLLRGAIAADDRTDVEPKALPECHRSIISVHALPEQAFSIAFAVEVERVDECK